MTDNKPPSQPDWHRLHLWQIQPLRDAVMVFLVLGLLYLGKVLSIITVPLLVALGFAYLVEPIVGWLTRIAPWMGRKVAVLLMMAIIGLVSLILMLSTVPVVVKQAASLMKNADTYVANVRGFAHNQDLPEWIKERLQTWAEFLPKPTTTEDKNDSSIVPPDTAAAVVTSPPADILDEERIRRIIRDEMDKQSSESTTRGVLDNVAHGAMQVFGFLSALIGGVAQVGIFVFVAAFCFFFFSTSFPAVREYLGTFIPVSNRERILELIGKMDMAISGFVRGRLMICFFMSLMYAIGWTICGIPHAVLLGLATGALGLIPYFSAVGLPIAWALLAVSLHGSSERTGFYYTEAVAGGVAGLAWWKIIVFPWLVNAISQATEDYVLNPMIQGKATNLHPATILLACIAGGVLGGLYGMILAIPVTACIKIMMDEILLPRLKLWLDGRRDDPLPL
jgi:predicted PurR-regulated permease PerM